MTAECEAIIQDSARSKKSEKIMHKRIFLRILFNNLLRNNIFSKTIISLVNFCKEFGGFNYSSLKYKKNMSLSLNDTKKNIFFQSIGGDRIDCK